MKMVICMFDKLTNSPYVNKKYEEFYKKHGYIPEIFNPYHCSEITDIAPTLTSGCGSTTTSATVLIVVKEKS